MIKKEGRATLEIPYYDHKNDWLKEKSQNTSKKNNEIVIVNPIPNKKYYKFYSIDKSIKKSNIDKLNAFSVQDVSKDNKMIWKKYPYEMVFIEKVDSESYIFWLMKPVFNE
ncbi:MAG: hypothetical protein AB8B65_12075 [Kordia sp.]|uniref:hypothetical protein n=1 Tax=Kordia sp. TaxID=1965332 RepID=UPI00385EF9B9